MVTGQSLIIVSCLWQSYDHWRGQHEHDLIPKINAFCEKVRPHADVMWANDHINEIHDYLGIEAARQPTVYSGLLIKNTASGELIYSFNPDTAGTIKRFIEKPYREFLINFKVVDDSLRPTLPAGTYEAVPYVIIESNDVPPDQLIEALSEGYSEFSENYFNYPLYRTGGKFTVTE